MTSGPMQPLWRISASPHLGMRSCWFPSPKCPILNSPVGSNPVRKGPYFFKPESSHVIYAELLALGRPESTRSYPLDSWSSAMVRWCI
uniref:Uncharacterized protein n=1 Tax=Lepeophtheirus salmonis TaxID=72036 RepID=A0A0K2U4J5_LEPSM